MFFLGQISISAIGGINGKIISHNSKEMEYWNVIRNKQIIYRLQNSFWSDQPKHENPILEMYFDDGVRVDWHD